MESAVKKTRYMWGNVGTRYTDAGTAKLLGSSYMYVYQSSWTATWSWHRIVDILWGESTVTASAMRDSDICSLLAWANSWTNGMVASDLRRHDARCPVSIADKTSYRKISWSFEAARSVFQIYHIAWKFDRHIGSTAAGEPVKLQSDRTILKTNLAASRLYEIFQ